MTTPVSHADDCPSRSVDSVAALFSAIIPSAGHFLHGRWAAGSRTCLVGLTLAGIDCVIWQLGGAPAAIFFAMIVVLPWWCIQAYEASFVEPPGFRHTMRLIGKRAHDIRFLGALFLLTALMDLYIIVANPEYSLTIFCSKPDGLPGILAKIQSPTLHVAIGYGFLTLARWGLFLYYFYAGFGLLNATVNLACLGYGRIRTVFLISLIAFTVYVYLRRHRFLSQHGQATR